MEIGVVLSCCWCDCGAKMSSDRRKSSIDSYRRKLQYHALIDDVQSIDELNTDVIIEKTKYIVTTAEKLLTACTPQEKVEHPSENLLDSKLLLATSDVVARCTDNISGNSNVYNSLELAENFKSNFAYWNNVVLPGQIPSYNFLYGTFTHEPSVQKSCKARKKIEKKKPTSLSQPEKVTHLQKSEDGSEIVSKILNILKKTYKQNNMKPVNFFKFVLHPHDFGRTIENIYHVSFLIKDTLAALEINESDGLPYISPISKDDRAKVKRDESDSNQFVLSLDMDEWKEAVVAFNIKNPFLDFKYK